MPLEHPVVIESLEVEAARGGHAGSDGRESGRVRRARHPTRTCRLEDTDRWDQADELPRPHVSPTHRCLGDDAFDDDMERCRAEVDEVRRHLDVIANRETERLDAWQAAGRLAHRPRDGLRVLERATELEVERNERRPHADEHDPRSWVDAGRPVRRRQLGRGDPPSELLEPAPPVERGPPPLADLAVEEDRESELVTHSACDGVRHGDRLRQSVGRQRHHRDNVRRAHARMGAGMEPEIDPSPRLVDARDQPVLDRALVSDERDHGAVVIGVEVNVEHSPASGSERRCDRVHRGAIPTLGEVRDGFEQRHRPTLRPMSRSTAPAQLAKVQRRNARCRRCLEAGFPIVPSPVFAGHGGQRAYLFGLAPGRVEAETGRPWQGRAGRTLRRWLRLDEEAFFASFYCASVTRCFPGPSPSGRGDRRATRAEEALCESWRDDELRLLDPALVVTVGLTPATHLLGVRRLGEAVGKSFLLGDALAIPLPHPSGASGWLNDPANRARLGKATTHVRRELSRLNVT